MRLRIAIVSLLVLVLTASAQEMTKAMHIQGLTMRGQSALPRIALAFSPGETGVRVEGEADGGFATAGTGTT